jgi:broad specificity phosphatase PhoE
VPAPVIYYVRHGLTDWNVEQRLQGRCDTPLNEQGRAQASRCGEILGQLLAREGRRPASLDYVSSPLLRARATMELMRGALGLDPCSYEVDGRLAELSFGEWDGLTYTEIMGRHGDLLARREADKWSFAPPAGESYADVARRVGEWCSMLRQDSVVTAHGGTARALLAHLAIVPPEAAPHYSIEQGVVYIFIGNRVARYA